MRGGGGGAVRCEKVGGLRFSFSDPLQFKIWLSWLQISSSAFTFFLFMIVVITRLLDQLFCKHSLFVSAQPLLLNPLSSARMSAE